MSTGGTLGSGRVSRTHVLLLGLLSLLFPPPSHAGIICFWTGNGVGPQWSRILNWGNYIRPQEDDDAWFESGVDNWHHVDVDQPWTIHTLFFRSDDQYMIDGSQLTFLDGGVDMQTDHQGRTSNHGFICPTRFQGQDALIVNYAGDQLTFAGDVSLALNEGGYLSISNERDSPVVINGDIGGTGVVRKSGPGTLTLSGSGDYVGLTAIDEGTIRCAADEVIGRGTLLIDNGGVLDLNGHNETVGPGAVHSTGVGFTGGGWIDLGGTNNVLTISSSGTWISQDYGGTSSIDNGQLDLATTAGTRIVNVWDTASLTLTSRIIGGGDPGATPSMRKTGAGLLVLSGPNAFVRSFSIDGGAVEITDAAALGAPGSGNETILAGGSLLIALDPPGGSIGEIFRVMQPGLVSSLADCHWAGPIEVPAASVDLSAGPGAILTVSGVVSGAASQGLRKVGPGTLVLSNANTYSGGTLIVQGNLVADAPSGSPTGSGPVTVQAGAVLQAQGSLAGAVTLEPLGTLEVGDPASIAALTLPAFTAQAQSTVKMDIGGGREADPSDRVQVTGTAVFAGRLDVSALTVPALGDSFMLVTYANHTGQFDAVEFPPLDPSQLWELHYGSTSLSLHVVGAPSALPAAENETSPASLRLQVSGPNPMRAATTLRFDLPRSGPVDVRVYDVRGREVAKIVEGADLNAGTHVATWNGCDATGADALSGVYFVRLTTAGGERTAKIRKIRR